MTASSSCLTFLLDQCLTRHLFRCGHCKKLAPTWDALAAEYSSNESVRVATVDCTSNKSVCQKAAIGGYPTLKVYYDGQDIETYRGAYATYSSSQRVFQDLHRATTCITVQMLASTISHAAPWMPDHAEPCVTAGCQAAEASSMNSHTIHAGARDQPSLKTFLDETVERLTSETTA